MQGLVLSQQTHVVNALPPIDLNGGVNSDVWSMKNHGHATIIIQIGVSAGAVPTFTITECDNFTPSNETAIAFAVYKCETAADDVLAAKTAATTAGVAMSTNNNIFYVVEIDARQLTDAFPCMRVKFSNPSASVIGSVAVILSGERFANDQSATAIA
jgi:hypothetical protein